MKKNYKYSFNQFYSKAYNVYYCFVISVLPELHCSFGGFKVICVAKIYNLINYII